MAARKEPAPASARRAAAAPQPPDLKTFVEKRTASVEAQLAGKSKGYVPRFGFGPPGGGPGAAAAAQPADRREDVPRRRQGPAGVRRHAVRRPAEGELPRRHRRAPTGEVFVAVDEQGSLGRTPGGGRVLRCVDKDGDGKVDDVKVFAKMEHPRGADLPGRLGLGPAPADAERLPRRRRRRRRRPVTRSS